MTARRLFFSRAGLALAALVLPALLLVAAALPARAQDSTDFFLRLNRLENQVRELSGTVEKLQFENRRLQDQLKRFQEDVEFRFQEQQGSGAQPAPPKQKRSDLGPQDASPTIQATTPAPPASSLPADAAAAGTEMPAQPEGEAVAAAGESTEKRAEPQVNASIAGEQPAGSFAGPGRPLDLGAVAGVASRQSRNGSATASDGTAGAEDAAPIPSVAATAPGDPRASYDAAVALMRRQAYEEAEMSFRQFLQSHPRDKLAPDATFNLGESYFFRGRYREAAEQYLKLSTAYADSPRVPEGMLKLGMSLDALGARDQACATFSETTRKFPNVGADVKAALGRARSRANCA
ncbi:tol-pal system protein YbgF [Pseudochelatococcus lubricantis]|uniref:Cell division coordinator CpoB n=1 Tax=Pseudochelatococcus lubricantis TaxID=1538102 RepID=A0ABX0V2L8_9HYPH|nr:tol-pal system protein YbgF [Pseudochelatococcus lubricantis]NIJ59463.1 tol-pal system protein YbgF [Pseudochelatococcus lubricantis]